MIVLHLESSENKLFELDSSLSKKLVSMAKRSQKGEYFCAVIKKIFLDSWSFPFFKTLLKLSDHVFEKIRHESPTLKGLYLHDLLLHFLNSHTLS